MGGPHQGKLWQTTPRWLHAWAGAARTEPALLARRVAGTHPEGLPLQGLRPTQGGVARGQGTGQLWDAFGRSSWLVAGYAFPRTGTVVSRVGFKGTQNAGEEKRLAPQPLHRRLEGKDRSSPGGGREGQGQGEKGVKRRMLASGRDTEQVA